MKLNKYLSRIRTRRDVSFYNKELSLKNYDAAVIIPVYGEYEFIGKTLSSLAMNDVLLLADTLILLVVNNPEINANPDYISENLNLLKGLNSFSFIEKFGLTELSLAWIDAASDGKALAGKGGVGVARKLGMDSVLEYLNWDNNPIIFSLDADTIVEKNYLSEIRRYFKQNDDLIGASINFMHLKGNTPEEEKAIREYEFSIRYYVENLKKAGSPYASHTIGSAMAFRADAYVKAGGMRQHRGGEDFYFMQELRKLGKVGEILDTTVYQSSRPSDRVPFGTGPKVQKGISGDELLLYNSTIFEVLGELLSKFEYWVLSGSLDKPEQFISTLPKEAREYLNLLDFISIWPKILVNNIKSGKAVCDNDCKKLIWAFHVWFDAFKTLKFVHYLERQYPEKYPRERISKWKR